MTDHHHDQGACGCGRGHHHPHERHETDRRGRAETDGASRGEGACERDGHHHEDGDEDGGDDDPRSPEDRRHSERSPSHHRHHAHTPTGADGRRRVATVLLLTGGFTLVEIAGGVLSGSLALIADAAHMLTDTAALGMAWIAFRLAERPPDLKYSYGRRRFEVLAAYTNGLALFVIAAGIVWEAARRFLDPQPVLASEMLVVAIVGLLVNILGFRILSGGERGNLNLRGALLHVMGDLLGSVAAIAAALVIRFTGWTPIDPILSVLVSLLILRGAWTITRESAHILLEGAPEDADAENVGAAAREARGVTDVHHVHTWSLSGERRVATLHAVVTGDTDGDGAVTEILGTLKRRFGIGHATIQIEREMCADRGHRD